jgi:molecular chaperone DnaJ
VPRDYYEVLGVSRTAGDAELKRAFRQLAMQYHPDKNPGDGHAEDRFKELNEAYGVLSDPDKRAHYDRFGTAGPGAGGFSGDFGSLFNDLFDVFAGSGRGRRQRVFQGEDLQYEMKITLEQAAAGLETKVQIPRMETCEACAGSGTEPGSRRVACEMCRGRGEVRVSQGFMTFARTCPKCQGAGEVNQHPCRTCRGEGRRAAERLLSIKIPAGIDDGMQLRLSGEGSSGINGGPAGDLYVVVRVEEHEVFLRKDADLHCDVPVSFPQLALGDEIEVPVINDGPAKLKIPAGSQPHQILRLKGKGLPRLRDRGHGDACFRLVLEVPHKLNAKQREALEAFVAASKGDRGPMSSAFLERMKKFLG